MAAHTDGPVLRVDSYGSLPTDVEVTLDGEPLPLVSAVTVHMEVDKVNTAMVKLDVDQMRDVTADQVTWVALDAIPTKVLEAELHDRSDRDRYDPDLVPWSHAVHERMTTHRMKRGTDAKVLVVSGRTFDLLDLLGVEHVWGLNYTTRLGVIGAGTDEREVLDVGDLELETDEAARLRLEARHG